MSPDTQVFLPLRPDFVSQDEIGDEAQGDEENAQNDEVQVELGVLHVQLPQDGLRLLEVARLIDATVQVLSVQPVDGQDDPFEPIPGEEGVGREQGPPRGQGTPRPRACLHLPRETGPPVRDPQGGPPPSLRPVFTEILPSLPAASQDKRIQRLGSGFPDFCFLQSLFAQHQAERRGGICSVGKRAGRLFDLLIEHIF